MTKTFDEWFDEDFFGNPRDYSVEFGHSVDFQQKNRWKSVSFFKNSDSVFMPLCKINFKESEYATVHYGEYHDLMSKDRLIEILTVMEDLSGESLIHHYEL